jgi:Zn-dependent protease with chaperone function/RimJ/RimL family protein N-acetyltransferase
MSVTDETTGVGGDLPGRVRFPGISSQAYEHPADRSALVALRKLRGFDVIVRGLSGVLPERSLRLLFLSDFVRVDDRQFAHLHGMLRDACAILDLENVPAMYVAQDPMPNAMCVGMDAPIIVVTTGLLELLDDDEMRAVIGHEVGHALSGHSLYRTILLFITSLAVRVAWIPLGSVAITAIATALREWFRKSELSADRAGLLVGQDLEASMRGLMKVAGGNHLHEMHVDAFLAQAEDYEAAGDLRDSVLKILNVLPRSHPFATARGAELKRWASSEDYRQIMDGQYPLRRDDRTSSVYESLMASANHYAGAVRASRDPLLRLVTDISSGASDLGGRLRDRLGGTASQRPGGRAAGRATAELMSDPSPHPDHRGQRLPRDVRIREVRDGDIAVFYDHQRDPEATRMAAFPAREWDAFAAHWRRVRAADTTVTRTIVVDGQVAGNVVSWAQAGRRQVGYWVGREHWGRGVATTALALFLQHVSARPLHADVAAHNIGSIRVLERCGFRPAAGPDRESAAQDDIEELHFVLEA